MSNIEAIMIAEGYHDVDEKRDSWHGSTLLTLGCVGNCRGGPEDKRNK